MKKLILIPTYKERENIAIIYGKIRAVDPSSVILFIDDNSPDGTAAEIEAIAQRDPDVKLVRRPGKLGIGSAHLCGIRFAYEHGYDVLITMDCDITHDPRHIRDFMKLSETFDLVVGSRYLSDNSLGEWNFQRKMLTFLGHFMTKHVLRIPYDATGAFRLYRLGNIRRELFDYVDSTRYSFFFESLFILHRNGVTIGEAPIDLPARTYGHSKMSPKDILNSLWMLVKLFFRRRRIIMKQSAIAAEPKAAPDAEKSWDVYWSKKDNAVNSAYDCIAVFYRKHFIKSTLNHFIRKYFRKGDHVLHAGCGSGQVDTDISSYVNITAMDISKMALDVYRKENANVSDVMLGDIFAIPAANEAYDGIYNLGVMEHFTENEIRAILKEFHRVLRSGGKIVLFWPPRYGLSVIALRVIKRLLQTVLRREILLHPEEKTLLASRRKTQLMLEDEHFTVKEKYFGPRDAFTYVVLVAEKA